MIIPLGTDRSLRRPTQVTYALVLANVAIYVLGRILDPRGGGLGEGSPLARFILEPGHSAWWTFVSYAFLHGGFMHLLGNMVTLWVFGPNVEDRFGRIGYLLFYLAGGVGAGALHSMFEPNPVVGASGAIAAVTGAFIVLFPWTNIRTFCFFLVIGIFNIPAVWFIGTRIAYDFLLTGTGAGGRVATLAHLGGYAFGMGLSMLLLWTRVFPREPYDLFSTTRQAIRRRGFKEAGFIRDKSRAAARRASEQVDAIAARRAEIAEKLASGDIAGAGAGYRALLDQHGRDPAAAVLSRRVHYDLANALFKQGDHALASVAYDHFRTGYPGDPELPTVGLMQGLIHARYLNDPVRAKREINAVIDRLREGQERDLARQILADLG